MQYHAIPCTTMHYHAIPCNIMQYNAIPCNIMQYHASLITADGAYHCPVGSIWLFLSFISPAFLKCRIYLCFRSFLSEKKSSTFTFNKEVNLQHEWSTGWPSETDETNICQVKLQIERTLPVWYVSNMKSADKKCFPMFCPLAQSCRRLGNGSNTTTNRTDNFITMYARFPCFQDFINPMQGSLANYWFVLPGTWRVESLRKKYGTQELRCWERVINSLTLYPAIFHDVSL